MDPEQQVKFLEDHLESVLVKINTDLRFSEPVSSKKLHEVQSLLEKLFVPNDQVTKNNLYRCHYTLMHFQDMQAYVPSNELLDRIKDQLKLFQKMLLSSLKPSNSLDVEAKKIYEWREAGFKSLYRNRDLANELLIFLDSISFQYKDIEKIPKEIAFHLYDLIITFMNEGEFSDRTSTQFDREKLEVELFFDICDKVRNIYIS